VAANGTVHGGLGFFKHTRSYPMFSVVEPHRRFDDYGEEINPNDFVDASADAMALAVPAAPADLPVPHPLLLRPGVEAAAAAAPPPPSKVVVQEITVALACRLLMIELEGLADAKSVKAILERVAPRKLVRPASAAAAGYCDWGFYSSPALAFGLSRAADPRGRHRGRHARHEGAAGARRRTPSRDPDAQGEAGGGRVVDVQHSSGLYPYEWRVK